MGMIDRDQLKQTFSTIPDLYDEARPDYPAALVDAVLAPIERGAPLRILEVGCGTGQATGSFGAAGHQILAIDIGADLVAVARRRLIHLPNVRFAVAPFETIELPACGFDLLISAQAFHWVDPAIGFPKAQRLLAAGGRIALFWNFLDLERARLPRALRDTWLRHAPVFAYMPDASTARFETFVQEWQDAVGAAGLFTAIEASVFARELAYTHERLRKLLATFSWTRTLGESARLALFAEVATLLAGAGDPLALPVRTLLITANKSQRRDER